jgi:hypothetical protein
MATAIKELRCRIFDMAAARVQISEKVPPGFCRIFLFLGENDFRAVVGIAGGNELRVGTNGKTMSRRADSEFMDWQATAVMAIRHELQMLEKNGESFAE